MNAISSLFECHECGVLFDQAECAKCPGCAIAHPPLHRHALFAHMHAEHGLTLTDSEMDEICRCVARMEAPGRLLGAGQKRAAALATACARVLHWATAAPSLDFAEFAEEVVPLCAEALDMVPDGADRLDAHMRKLASLYDEVAASARTAPTVGEVEKLWGVAHKIDRICAEFREGNL